jgi:hypothetical protein
MAAQMICNGDRHFGAAWQPLDGGGHLFGHCAEELDPRFRVELAAGGMRFRWCRERRAWTAARRAPASPVAPSARRTLPRTASRPLMPARRACFARALYSSMKVRPAGAGISR